jgi:hypothetical protein
LVSFKEVKAKIMLAQIYDSYSSENLLKFKIFKEFLMPKIAYLLQSFIDKTTAELI